MNYDNTDRWPKNGWQTFATAASAVPHANVLPGSFVYFTSSQKIMGTFFLCEKTKHWRISFVACLFFSKYYLQKCLKTSRIRLFAYLLGFLFCSVASEEDKLSWDAQKWWTSKTCQTVVFRCNSKFIHVKCMLFGSLLWYVCSQQGNNILSK